VTGRPQQGSHNPKPSLSCQQQWQQQRSFSSKKNGSAHRRARWWCRAASPAHGAPSQGAHCSSAAHAGQAGRRLRQAGQGRRRRQAGHVGRAPQGLLQAATTPRNPPTPVPFANHPSALLPCPCYPCPAPPSVQPPSAHTPLDEGVGRLRQHDAAHEQRQSGNCSQAQGQAPAVAPVLHSIVDQLGHKDACSKGTPM
jgi:hypothetical protein